MYFLTRLHVLFDHFLMSILSTPFESTPIKHQTSLIYLIGILREDGAVSSSRAFNRTVRLLHLKQQHLDDVSEALLPEGGEGARGLCTSEQREKGGLHRQRTWTVCVLLMQMVLRIYTTFPF